MQIGFGRVLSAESLQGMDDDARKREVSRHLGSFFLQTLIEQMWETVPDGGLIPKPPGEKIFRGFLNEKLAYDLSGRLPIGARPRRGPDFAAGGVQNGPAGTDRKEWRG